MNTSLLRSALVLCALAALPREAAAQPARTAEDPNFAEARRHFEAGVTAMQAEQWPEALAAFEQAHRLRRSAAASLNLASPCIGSVGCWRPAFGCRSFLSSRRRRSGKPTRPRPSASSQRSTGVSAASA